MLAAPPTPLICIDPGHGTIPAIGRQTRNLQGIAEPRALPSKGGRDRVVVVQDGDLKTSNGAGRLRGPRKTLRLSGLSGVAKRLFRVAPLHRAPRLRRVPP